MKRYKLPAIVESVKQRPLGYNPLTNEFIYYDNVAAGKQKLYPINKLSLPQLQKLAIERTLTNIPSQTVTLNGEVFSNEQLADEIKKQSKIGKQIFDTDINYLNYFLSTFPDEAFEK